MLESIGDRALQLRGVQMSVYKERESERATGQIREQSDASLTLTESLMKVRGYDWLGAHSDEICHGDSCWGDLGLQRTDSRLIKHL